MTVTAEDFPVAALYVEELEASGVYEAVRVSVPTASKPAAMFTVAFPAANVFDAEVNAPLLRVTEPVGTGLPLPPLTATTTERACAVVMLNDDGVTVMVGVVFAAGGGGVVDPPPLPPHAVRAVARLTAIQSAAL